MWSPAKTVMIDVYKGSHISLFQVYSLCYRYLQYKSGILYFSDYNVYFVFSFKEINNYFLISFHNLISLVAIANSQIM